jgi:hypothetical protein
MIGHTVGEAAPLARLGQAQHSAEAGATREQGMRSWAGGNCLLGTNRRE